MSLSIARQMSREDIRVRKKEILDDLHHLDRLSEVDGVTEEQEIRRVKLMNEFEEVISIEDINWR